MNYDPKPMEFIRIMDLVSFWNHLPTMMHLFDIFWPTCALYNFIIEINQYATKLNLNGKYIRNIRLERIDSFWS